ncbi:methylmalonyl Co-A mutase-associated GTPase MeaB [Desulfolithobacter sp.]
MSTSLASRLHEGDPRAVGRAISLVENHDPAGHELLAALDRKRIDRCLVLGITGPPGAGKSTLTGQLIRCIREQKMRMGVIGVDPSSPISGGALLGDRIRMMDHALDRDVVVRSMATRGRLGGLCAAAGAAVRIMAASGCRIVIIETVGIGQSEMDIVSLADLTLMVLAPGFGDDIQAMKAGILEVADLLVVNKSDQPGARKLFLDMTTVLRDPEEREQRIIETVASEGRGVAELLERVLELEAKQRSQGLFQRRRDESFITETLDWAMELLAHPLRERIRRSASTETDPRLAAEHLLRDILK